MVVGLHGAYGRERGRESCRILAVSFLLPFQAYREGMWIVLLVLVVAWVILAIVGFAIEGLLWLGVIGVVLVVGTLLFGILKQRDSRKKTGA